MPNNKHILFIARTLLGMAGVFCFVVSILAVAFFASELGAVCGAFMSEHPGTFFPAVITLGIVLELTTGGRP